LSKEQWRIEHATVLVEASGEPKQAAVSPHVIAHYARQTARADQVDLIKSRTAHYGMLETSITQVASDEARTPQISTGKIGAIQKNIVKLRLAEIGMGKINPIQFRIAEHESGEHAFFIRSEDQMQTTTGAQF
jgi:hypothetical protein